jgi:uncharacterized membrane protein
MDAFIANVLYNPLPLIGAMLSFFAALVFLVFLRGFLSSVMFLFTLNGNDDFLLNARKRVTWAFLLLVFFFCLWQIIRFVGAIITGGEWPAGLSLAIILLIALFVINRALTWYKKKETGGH